MGSPPQVRGKLVFTEGTDIPLRITPAGAGKTTIKLTVDDIDWDHPRRCGENYLLVLVSVEKPGSPPQVRGKRDAMVRRTAGDGITPAGAGKTRFHEVYTGQWWDHPRRCGENLCFQLSAATITGITPAGAGKTRRVNMLDNLA